MPVSHLGLTVSHIPSSTSFYLAALQPLGYRFLGTQGNTVALGVREADLFLCPVARGVKVVPTHVAFTAKSRLAVRSCYTASLEAGGWPSGAPSYRNDDCSCFNAAVEDLDGNTIEFIFRESDGESSAGDAPTRDSLSDGRRRVVVSLARSNTSLDHPNTTPPRTPQLKRSSTMPVPDQQPTPGTGRVNNGSRALMGTLLGAAAGAAFAFAMVHAERDNAQQEVAFSKATSRGRDATKSSRTSHRSTSEMPIAREHRNWSETESRYSARPRTTVTARQQRAIAYNQYEEEDDVQRAITNYTLSRPKPSRSRTYDTRVSDSMDHRAYVPRRSTTVMELPSRQPLLLTSSGDHSVPDARSVGHDEDGQITPSRRDSALSVTSRRSSRHTSAKNDDPRLTKSKASTSRSLQRDAVMNERTDTSTASHRSKVSTRSHRSKATSYFDAPERVQEPLDLEDPAELSDGLGDARTIVPDDSISCIDLSRPRPARSDHSRNSERSHRRERTDRLRGERSDTARSAGTVKPSKSRHSAVTLPVRTRDQTGQRHQRDMRGAASYT